MGNDSVMDHASLPTPHTHILEHAEKLSKSYLNLFDRVPQNGVVFSPLGRFHLPKNVISFNIHSTGNLYLWL